MLKKLIWQMSVLLVFAGSAAVAQSRSELEDQGYAALNAHDYVKAYECFDKLHARYPKELDYELKLGISALNYSLKKERALDIFKSMRTRYKTLEVEMYLGYAYHRNYKFDEAISTLTPLVEEFTNSKKKEDKTSLEMVKLVLKNCENGKMLIQNKVFADIINIGPPINTKETEGVPVITMDESMMLFTYVGEKSTGGKQNDEMKSDKSEGKYLSDIYISYKDSTGSNWLKPAPVDALNTKGNDAAIAISPDGETIFTFLSNNQNEGDILVSKRTGKTFSPPVPLNSNINTPDHWEGSCSISSDGRFLYFASDRPDGQGGRDIWVSELVNGDWGPAVNMGPKINTPLDEDAPFIHPDGITLFFSSKGHMSIGDYDIMFSIKEGDEWIDPRSMGVPLNTVEDDRYYVINSKGDKGYFSSDRGGSGGFGSLDMYMVTPGILGEKPIVAVLKGTVFANDKPSQAKVEVLKISRQENIGPFHASEETGKYLMALSPGHTYRIKVSAEGYDPVEEDLDIETLTQYVELTKDFYLYTAAYIAANPEPPRKSGVVTIGSVPGAAKPAESVAQQTTATNQQSQPETSEPVAQTATKTETPAAQNAETSEPANPNETPAEKPEPVTKPTTEPETQEPVTKQEKPETVTPPANTETEKTEVATTQPEKKKTSAGEQQQLAATNKTRSATGTQASTGKEETETPAPPCSSSLPDISILKGKSLNDAEKYKQMLNLLGDYCNDEVEFTVQIGAYKHPQNYKYEKLKELGQVESQMYPDSITRFTQSRFKTIRAAEKFRQKAIRKGQKDAWIVAFVGGRRYTLEDLITSDFLLKPVN